jgi:hypothetical protein
MPEDQSDQARVRLLRTLMAKVSEDTYPSATMMDTIEELLQPDEVAEYADVLLGHVENDTYPSTPMIYRLRNLSW